mgnify:CR=1 FL=1
MPPQSGLYERIIKICEEVAKNYGYEFVLAPHLEQTALFRRSVGESSDIVGKEMYQFEDKAVTTFVCVRRVRPASCAHLSRLNLTAPAA